MTLKSFPRGGKKPATKPTNSGLVSGAFSTKKNITYSASIK